MRDNVLTILIPTRNRPCELGMLVRFLYGSGLRYPVVVSDSSDHDAALAVNEVCDGLAEVRRYPPSMAVSDKLIFSLEGISTPHVVMLPDDDVTLPHAIEASLAHLVEHPDVVAAQGYVLDLGIHERLFDIARVRWFTPSVDQEGPVDRIYNLIRRYQPFLWAVFRTEVILKALKAARIMPMIVFQEMTIMSCVAAQGKIARLPCIYTLRGTEESLSALVDTHPFYAFLDDPMCFFQLYGAYRTNLAAFIRSECGVLDLVPELHLLKLPARAKGDFRPSDTSRQVTLEHALDIIHAICFQPEIDGGMLNYTIQRMLGAAQPPIPITPQWQGWRDLQAGDLLHEGPGGQRFLWRRDVLDAEPRNEIRISPDEIARVEAQLTHYVPA